MANSYMHISSALVDKDSMLSLGRLSKERSRLCVVSVGLKTRCCSTDRSTTSWIPLYNDHFSAPSQLSLPVRAHPCARGDTILSCSFAQKLPPSKLLIELIQNIFVEAISLTNLPIRIYSTKIHQHRRDSRNSSVPYIVFSNIYMLCCSL
jgi:hypothetical protein